MGEFAPLAPPCALLVALLVLVVARVVSLVSLSLYSLSQSL